MALRPLAESDLQLMLSWRNAPSVRVSMYSPNEISLSAHLAWFDRIKDDARVRWLVYEDDSSTPRGIVYFTDIRVDSSNAFWGFYRAPNAPSGTGARLCFEALKMAFEELNLHKLNADVLGTNGKSLHLHRKLGFQQEGYFRDFHFNGAIYVDVVRFGLLRSEWQGGREPRTDGTVE